jgi:hypothetical protein
MQDSFRADDKVKGGDVDESRRRKQITFCASHSHTKIRLLWTTYIEHVRNRYNICEYAFHVWQIPLKILEMANPG